MSEMAVSSAAGTAGARDYFELLKPRVMSLVVFTAGVGMAVAPDMAHLGLALIALLAIAIGAGASGALNMAYDADIDRLMARTARRPVPSGRIEAAEAAAFGVILALLSVLVLLIASNYLAAGLLAFTIFFYAVIYTRWLKRSTAQNIVIGGAAGALPPVIGWAAMTGEAPLAAWSLFLIIFLWTPPHFWALALTQKADFARARLPMLPNVAGDAAARKQIFLYALLLFLSTFLPLPLGLGGGLYLGMAALLGGSFLFLTYRLLSGGDAKTPSLAPRVFTFSILYLFGLFAALLMEAALGLQSFVAS